MLRLLDSTVLIDHLRGRPVVSRVAGLRRLGDVPATTAINVEEVVRGLRAAEVDGARLLLGSLVLLPLDEDVAWQAGTWRREWAQRGVTLSQPDCMVAAAAHVHGAVVATGNPRHFVMPEVHAEHWPVGE